MRILFNRRLELALQSNWTDSNRRHMHRKLLHGNRNVFSMNVHRICCYCWRFSVLCLLYVLNKAIYHFSPVMNFLPLEHFPSKAKHELNKKWKETSKCMANVMEKEKREYSISYSHFMVIYADLRCLGFLNCTCTWFALFWECRNKLAKIHMPW